VKLIALLSWYDEPTWCLTELVASLARAGVDHVVAVDGAYALYPEGRAQSPGEQAQAILAASQGAGMGCSLHAPRDVWFGNEVEKRTFLFAAGHQVAEPGEDWLWVADADEVVTESTGIRDALEQTTFDVGEVVLDAFSANGGEGQAFIRKLFRAQSSGIWLRDNHFTYMTGDNRMLWQGAYSTSPELMAACPLHFVRVSHRSFVRDDHRMAQRRRYYDRRRDLHAELETV
jgi:hypothetical protein